MKTNIIDPNDIIIIIDIVIVYCIVLWQWPNVVLMTNVVVIIQQ